MLLQDIQERQPYLGLQGWITSSVLIYFFGSDYFESRRVFGKYLVSGKIFSKYK